MTNREWVTLHILWGAVSSHLFLWPTACEWHSCTCSEWQSHQIYSHYQQQVSDIAHFVKGSLMASSPMTNREWVPLHILWKAASSHLSLLLTGCEWHCMFCEWQSHHIFSYDQQFVSEIAHVVPKGILIASFPMANSLWAALHNLWKAVSLHLVPWPTVCEWLVVYFVNCSVITPFPMTNSEWVTWHSFVKGSLITFSPMTNREWVPLHILTR